MTRIERIAELQKELNDCIALYLTQESIECVDDAYQEALEISWFKDDLRDQIKHLESLSDEQFINDFPELLDKDEEYY